MFKKLFLFIKRKQRELNKMFACSYSNLAHEILKPKTIFASRKCLNISEEFRYDKTLSYLD